MKAVSYLIAFILLNSTSFTYSQLILRDNESTPNTLLVIDDEGEAGSVILPPLLNSPGDVDQKLYNILGELYWNGNKVGTSFTAAGWTDIGSSVILATASDKVGIGPTNPAANLHIEGNEGLLVQGEHGMGTPQNHGDGCRLHFYPLKSAFRAGYSVGNVWNDSNIGDYSVAMGLGTVASGFASVATGEDSYASGWASTALGMNAYATGWGSTSLGIQPAATGYGTIAIGNNIHAESYLSTVLGVNNIGGGTTDSWIPDDPLLEIGNGFGGSPSNAVTVLKNGRIGIGINNPSHKLDINGGNFLVRGEDGYTAVGHTGIVYLGSIHSFIKAEYGYGVKIGAYAAADAISIKELSGDVGIGTTTPNEKLEVNGKVRSNSSFNVNGTDGISGTFDFYNDGTPGNIVRMTFVGGILTSVEKAP